MNESFGRKIADILKNVRVWILIVFVLLSIVAVNYSFSDKGAVVINGISVGSAAEKAGMSFDSRSNLRNLEKVLYLDNTKIENTTDFYDYVSGLDFNSSVDVITDKNPEGYLVDLSSESGNRTALEILGISVRPASNSNIKLGIELEGGSRLILRPVSNITEEEFDLLITSLQNRLDIYGASGTKVNKLEDAFTGEKFVIVESTSSNKNDIFDLISRQGNFEAKVGDTTVFTGQNVLKVFNDPTHAGLESCGDTDGGKVCSFRFSIEIDEEGANKFFEQTSKLNVVAGGHLSEKVYFYLDGEEITGLNVASSFKYQKITNPQITVSGNPMPTQEKAIESGQREMKLLQTILSTQSLPSELEVVQSYSISSSSGSKFLSNAFLVGLTALLLVAGIVALRYRQLGVFAGIMIALFSEVIIVFGVAAFMKLTIDLAAIGGLIAAIGTGVDDQIIITDEYFRDKNKNKSSKNKIKGALYIIMISYFTTVAAMLPLQFAGLKMLQGFAFMILIGVTVGVFITRPAYAAILRVLMTTREERKAEDEKDEN